MAWGRAVVLAGGRPHRGAQSLCVIRHAVTFGMGWRLGHIEHAPALAIVMKRLRWINLVDGRIPVARRGFGSGSSRPCAWQAQRKGSEYRTGIQWELHF